MVSNCEPALQEVRSYPVGCGRHQVKLTPEIADAHICRWSPCTESRGANTNGNTIHTAEEAHPSHSLFVQQKALSLRICALQDNGCRARIVDLHLLTEPTIVGQNEANAHIARFAVGQPCWMSKRSIPACLHSIRQLAETPLLEYLVERKRQQQGRTRLWQMKHTHLCGFAR